MLKNRLLKTMKIIFTVLFLVNVSTIFPQVNIESLRKELGHQGFSGSLDLGISIRTGSVNVQEISAKTHINSAQPKFHLLLIGEGNLGWQGGKRFSNSGLAHLRFVHRLRTDVQPEIFVQTNYNSQRKLLERYLAGVGIRINAINTESQLFSIGLSGMYEFEKLKELNFYEENITYSNWRWSSYINYGLNISEGVKLSNISYYQPMFDDFSDFRLLNNTQFSFKFIEPLRFNFTFSLLYDDDPPSGVPVLDTRTRFGFGLSF